MTSPNRETEAQQVEARVEQIVLTKVKASLRGKTGTIRVNLEQQRTITGQERQKTGMLRISTAGRQEMVREAVSGQEKATVTASGQEQEETEMPKISKAGRQEMAKEAVTNQEKVTAVISGQEREETEMPKTSKAGHQETAKEAVTNQEKVTAVISDREKAGTGKAVPSGLRALEAQEALQVSNRVHSKKAVPKKCQEMKAAVM